MYIEFIGFSSSGKTTLIEEVCSDFKKNNLVFNILELEYLNTPYRVGWDSKYLSLLIDLKILFRVLRLVLLKESIYRTRGAPLPLLRKINYIRNHIKKKYLLKFYQNNMDNNKITIADEGDIQSFLNISIHSNSESKFIDYKKTILPDILIYLKPSKEELIRRILLRNNRHQWSSLSLIELENYIDKFYKSADLFIKRSQCLDRMKVLSFDDKIENKDISEIILKNIIY